MTDQSGRGYISCMLQATSKFHWTLGYDVAPDTMHKGVQDKFLQGLNLAIRVTLGIEAIPETTLKQTYEARGKGGKSPSHGHELNSVQRCTIYPTGRGGSPRAIGRMMHSRSGFSHEMLRESRSGMEVATVLDKRFLVNLAQVTRSALRPGSARQTTPT